MVTTFALGADEFSDTLRLVPTRGRAVVVERADAADLLPLLQAAVVLATAGTDRHDRVWPYPEGNHGAAVCELPRGQRVLEQGHHLALVQ